MSTPRSKLRQKTAQEYPPLGLLTTSLERLTVDDPLVTPPQAAGAYAAGDNRVWSIAGTNAADGDATSDSEGGIRVRSGGSADDETALVLNTNHHNLVVKPGQQPVMAAMITTDADDITEIQYLIGFASDDDGDDPFDGDNGELDPNNSTAPNTVLAFSFDTDDNDTNWQVDVIDNGGTISSTNTGVAVAADTDYVLAVEVDSQPEAHFYIDGTHVHSSGVLSSTDTMGPVLGVSQLAGNVRDLFVRRAPFSKVINV